MKDLRTFILEELDDNIFWLIDTWFERNEVQREEFMKIVINFLKKPIDKKEVESLLQNTSLNGQLKEFVNFIQNNIQVNDEIDYIEYFIHILKQVIYKEKIKGVH